jgi:TetR/AcrR family transcriptional regulator of autoinduction and epiphytic fitness
MIALSAIALYSCDVTYEELALDRHHAQKLENTRAIKNAALQLAEERGLGNFTVEELAARAEVSRRTFFNHFGSIQEAIKAGLRDMVLDASESVMGQLVGGLSEAKKPGTEEVFRLLSDALLSVDFTDTIRRICAVLGVEAAQSGLHNTWFGEVFAAVLEDFDDLLEAQAPDITAVERRLLARVMLTSVEVSAEQWCLTSLQLPHAAALDAWQQIHGSTINRLTTGYSTK